jgi:A/G-specific adenine glycosylase
MSFSSCLIAWQKQHGRHDLPWQNTRDPYRIWVSEIMLQQTQVAAVIPYFQRFMRGFPDLQSLAGASQEQVLTHWAGLGYYARGRNLHRAARQIMEKHAGHFPADFAEMLALPGVGRSTAAAIGTFAFGQARAILDGNVKRVLARVFGVSGWPGEKRVENKLWLLAESLLPVKEAEAYIQAQMDLGATICTRSKPKCNQCPLAQDCVARRENRIAQFPEVRPKKAIPQRAVTLLLLRHGNDVFLEKRPASGIWGGLWSLPETDALPEVACLQLTGQAAEVMRRLPVFTHTFTHFKLAISPVEITLPTRPQLAMSPGAVWMDRHDAINAATPKPVKSLLQSLC